MYQQPLQQQRWPLKKARPQSHGRMKEERHEDYEGDGDEGQPTLDQHAGAVARQIIRASEVDDTTEHWRALKRAFIAGYEFAQRT